MLTGLLWYLAGQRHLGLVVNAMTLLAFLVTGLYFWRVLSAPDLGRQDRGRLRAFIWLFAAAALFWLIYDQGAACSRCLPSRTPGARPSASAFPPAG